MANKDILNDGKTWGQRSPEEKQMALMAWHGSIAGWFLANLKANVEAEERGENPLGVG
jgi:hypothetical protein